MSDRKILLPGISTLIVLISKVRDRVAKRLWKKLSSLASPAQKEQLENLLLTPIGQRYSKLDELKKGPTNISSIGLNEALARYQFIKNLGIGELNFGNIPKAKINYLARYVTISWAPAVSRMPDDRKIAVLIAFAYVYETKSLDDALDLLDVLITEITAKAVRSGEKKRMRSLGDLDRAAINLSDFADLFVKNETNQDLVSLIYKVIPKDFILNAVQTVRDTARTNSGKYYEEQIEQYRTVRRFLPTLLKTLKFKATSAGQPMLKALEFLTSLEGQSC